MCDNREVHLAVTVFQTDVVNMQNVSIHVKCNFQSVLLRHTVHSQEERNEISSAHARTHTHNTLLKE